MRRRRRRRPKCLNRVRSHYFKWKNSPFSRVSVGDRCLRNGSPPLLTSFLFLYRSGTRERGKKGVQNTHAQKTHGPCLPAEKHLHAAAAALDRKVLCKTFEMSRGTQEHFTRVEVEGSGTAACQLVPTSPPTTPAFHSTCCHKETDVTHSSTHISSRLCDPSPLL